MQKRAPVFWCSSWHRAGKLGFTHRHDQRYFLHLGDPVLFSVCGFLR